MKKKNRRNSTKYAALRPELNLKSRTELIDYDYLHKLSPEELQYLNDFSEEYNNAHIPKKNKIHKTKKLKKDCYDRNNARNRDVFTRAKAGNQLKYLEELRTNLVDDSLENRLIDKIDKDKENK